MVASYYAWDPEFDCITEETSAAGAITARYTQEPRPYGGLVSQRRGSATSYYHYDNVGTTRVLTNQAQSATLQTTYTAFGENVSTIGTTVNPFGFVGAKGYCSNPTTNDVLVRSRQFQPQIQRWLSADPMAFSDGMNLYSYCSNMPTKGVDPSGLTKIPFEFNSFIHKRLGLWVNEPGSRYHAEFRTDSRKQGEAGTSRISSTGWVESQDVGVNRNFYVKQTVGASHRRHWDTDRGRWVNDPPLTAPLLIDRINEYHTRRAIGRLKGGHCVTTIVFEAAAGYPYAWFAPSINYRVTFEFHVIAKNTIEVVAIGRHDGFPDYEAMVGSNRYLLYHYATSGTGPTLFNLNTEVTFISTRAVVKASTSEHCCVP